MTDHAEYLAPADDYLDDDAVTVDPQQNEWWLGHKRQGHRVEWPFAGLPMCFTCGVIYEIENPFRWRDR